jgi:hypothetical protein
MFDLSGHYRSWLAVWGSLSLIIVLQPQVVGRDVEFAIQDGTVMLTAPSGRERALTVGMRCTDLWVTPDKRAIAFVAVEAFRGHSVDASSDMIKRSAVYIAREMNDFSPVLVVSRTFVINGRRWGVVRHPKLSSDEQFLYFDIPFTMTTSRLMRLSLESNTYEELRNEVDFCTIWGGSYSGGVVIQSRHIASNPREGIVYDCDLLYRLKTPVLLNRKCPEFARFSAVWSARHDAVCK